MTSRKFVSGVVVLAFLVLSTGALAIPSFRTFMRAAAKTLLNTTDEVPGANKSEDRPSVGGPTEFLDSIQARTLMGRQVATDLTVNTSVGPVTLNRYYTTNPQQQEDEAYFPDTTIAPKLPAPPFDGLAQWTHSFYSFVTQRKNYVGADSPGDPRIIVTYETVRAPSGDTNTFDNSLVTSSWLPDRGSPSDTWMRQTDAGFIVRRPRDGRYYYEYLGVGNGSQGNASVNRWFLTRVESEEYANAAGAARTLYTVSYRTPSECGDAGVPGAYVDRVTMAEGQRLVFQYSTSNGTCGLARVDFRGADGGYAGGVRYTFSQGQLTQVDTLDPADAGVVSTRSYAYSTNSFFESYADGERELRYDLFALLYGVDGGVFSDVAGNSGGGLRWTYAGKETGCVDCNVYSSADMTSGAGLGQAVSVKQTVYSLPAGAGVEHVSQTKNQCISGNCAAVSDAIKTWTLGAAFLPNGMAIDETASFQDARGYFTNYSWAPSPAGIVNDELRSVARGALSDVGTGLLSTAYTYEYGGSARSPSTNDRLLRTESSPSATNPGQFVTTTYVHDLATNQLKAKISDGYTLLRGTATTPATNATRRYVGTFYFRSRVCEGSATDPLGRVLEVHGPCEVSGPTATDCPAGVANMPLKQFVYAAAGTGPGANLLSETRVSVKNGGVGACGGSNNTYLSTLYQNYDVRGRPGTVVGPDGVPTTQQYRGDLLVQKSVGTSAPLISRYFYDGAKLTATQNSDGTYDVVCYRSNDTSCTGGTLYDRPQWKAKAGDSTGTNWVSKTKYAYSKGRLITEQEYACQTGVCTGLSGALRRTLRHEADPYGRATYEQVGDEQIAQSPSSGGYYAASLFDAEGNQTAIGFPFVQHAQLCGGVVDGMKGHAGSSSNCAKLDYDAVNRLSAMQPVTSASVCVAYDSLGRVSSIALTQGLCTQPALEQVTYTYDDFGNLVRAKAPWTKGSNGMPDVNAYEYDGRGFMAYKQTPAMRTASAAEWLEYVYDANGRQLQVWHKNSATTPVAEMLYGFDYDAPNSSFPCAFSADGFAKGRVARRQDSYGSTWYKYDQFGHVLAEVRSRGQSAQSCGTPTLPGFGGPLCSTGTAVDPADSKLPAFYHYDGLGQLDAVQYPHGRVIRYAYSFGRVISISADLNISGTCQSIGLISNIDWEPWGGLRHYQISSPTTPSTGAQVDYYLGTHSFAACNAAAPASAGTTGRIGALYVSRGIGSGGDIYKAGYSWTADQLVSESQCLLSTSSTEKARTVYYADPAGDPSFRKGYDSALQLKYANRSTTAGFRLSDVGGAVGRRDYGYDSLGNRTAATTDCWKFSATYDGTRKDQLTAYTSISAAPNPTGATSPACDASPFATVNYAYDNDGRVATASSPVDSSGTPASQLSFSASIDDHAALGSVYRSISVNGAAYEYWYDADGRRRLKMYPQSGRDEFFYGLDNQLLEDRGLVQTGTPVSTDAHPLDEYVWLAGRPVIVLRSMLDSTWRRGNDSPTATCTRNYEASACGVYFVVSDYLPKPVLMLDSNLHVVNAAEYDPFGHVNRVASLGHTAHPYSQVNKSVLGYFAQPPTATTGVQLRARFSMVDTSGSGAYAYLGNDQNAQLNNIAGTLSAAVYGAHKGATLSEWVLAPTNGRARVVFHADANSSTYKGVALAAYEYRRFETNGGAKPTWIPIRFPGQYHDVETDLFQNWNRFYDASLGRYLEPDLLWSYPEELVPLAKRGRLVPVYAYAYNNPTSYSDPNGRSADTIQDFVRAFKNTMPDVAKGLAALGAAVSAPVAATAVVATAATAGMVSFVYNQTMAGDAATYQAFQSGMDGATPDVWVPAYLQEQSDEEGVIYVVPGSSTESGKEYVGRTENMGEREKDKSDGRDRTEAEIVDSFPKGDTQAGRTKEQQHMNDRGGKQNLDNKRNEVAPKSWPGRGIQPPR
jgi:RHS repeat-associated protein